MSGAPVVSRLPQLDEHRTGVLLPLSSRQYEGLARYSAVLVPLAGSMTAVAKHIALLAVSTMACTLRLALFVNVPPLF